MYMAILCEDLDVMLVRGLYMILLHLNVRISDISCDGMHRDIGKQFGDSLLFF